MDEEKKIKIKKIDKYNEDIAVARKNVIDHAIVSAIYAIFAVWVANQYLPNTVDIVRAFAGMIGIMSAIVAGNGIKAQKKLNDLKRLRAALLKEQAVEENVENNKRSR